MPVCPECRVEYAPGTTQCPDCRVPLAEDLASEASGHPDDQDFVTVFESQGDAMDYRMAKGLLESNGFHLKLIGGNDPSYPPLAAQIQVPETEAEAARALLNSTGPSDDDGSSPA